MPDKTNNQETTNLSFADPEFDGKKYEKTARAAKLQELGLTKQEYEAKVPLFWKAEREGQSLKQGFSGIPSGCSLDPENGMLAGGYVWSAEIRSGRKKALKLKAEYYLVYSGLENCEEEYAQLYFEKIARFASYPYFRALFSMCSANSGLAFAPLPSLIDRVD